MSPQLPPGYLYGQSIRSHEVAGFALSERFYPPGFKTPKHSHKRALLCFVMQGAYTESYGGHTRECESSTLLFHPPGELHAEHFHDVGGHSFIVEIEPVWLERVREQRGLPEAADGFHGGILELLSRRLYQEFVHVDEVSSLIIEGLMLEIMGEASRRPSLTEKRVPSWLEKTKDLLHSDFAKPLRLADVAHEAGVHPVHLAQTFHKFYRCTVGDYLRRLRIEYACHELASSHTPIVDIALAAGFCDQSHFTRTFKRLTGLVPSQYRDASRTT